MAHCESATHLLRLRTQACREITHSRCTAGTDHRWVLLFYTTVNHAIGVKRSKRKDTLTRKKNSFPLQLSSGTSYYQNLKLYLEQKRNLYQHKLHYHYGGTEGGLRADRKYSDNWKNSLLWAQFPLASETHIWTPIWQWGNSVFPT